jgi:hypothetical protein
MSAVAARGAANGFSAWSALTRRLRRVVCVVSGVLLASVAARAEAPVLTQEFWNYLVEFGDGKGDVFDPTDYAAMANLPAKTRQDIDRAAAQQRTPDTRSDAVAVPVVEEQPR